MPCLVHLPIQHPPVKLERLRTTGVKKTKTRIVLLSDVNLDQHKQYWTLTHSKM
mgnify:CR=1 FL=1